MRKLKYVKLFENLFEPKQATQIYFDGGSYFRDADGKSGELFFEFPYIGDNKGNLGKANIKKFRYGIDLITKYLNDEKPSVLVDSVRSGLYKPGKKCVLDDKEKKVKFEVGSKDTFTIEKIGSSIYQVNVPTKFNFTSNQYQDVSVEKCIYKIADLIEGFYR